MASAPVLRAQVRRRSTTPAICPNHHGNIAAFVCLKYGCEESFACMDCVVTNHKGHDMEKLETIAARKKTCLINRIKNGKKNILPSILQRIKMTEVKISESSTNTKDTQDAIFLRCQKIKAELDRIAQMYAESCTKNHENNVKKMTEHVNRLQALYRKCATDIKLFEETVNKGSDADIVRADRGKYSFPDVPNFLDMKLLKLRPGIIRTEDEFGSLVSMNDYNTTSIPRLDILEGENEQDNVKTTIKLNLLYLGNNNHSDCDFVCPLSDETRLYIWFYKSSVVSLITDHGEIINKITFKSSSHQDNSINAVCKSGDDDTLWAVSKSGHIQQVRPDGKQMQVLKYTCVNEEPVSLCVTRDQSILLGIHNPDQIVLLTNKGKIVRKISTKDIELCHSPFRINLCQKTGRLAIMDEQSISVVDEKFQHLFTLKGESLTSDGNTISTGYKPRKPFDPYNICFDAHRNLFVLDNYTVIEFNRFGQYVRTVYEDDDVSQCAVAAGSDQLLWIAYSNGVLKGVTYK